RYTPSGGIIFGVRRSESGLRVEVHDTGPGIALADQQAIFEEFRRGEDAGGQGLGLGLSIADRIAHLLHAPLSVRSRPGKGAMFAVELPKAESSMTALLHSSASPASKTGLSGRCVLALDNDPVSLDALRQVLVGWGSKVSVARDGAEAMAALENGETDLWLF